MAGQLAAIHRDVPLKAASAGALDVGDARTDPDPDRLRRPLVLAAAHGALFGLFPIMWIVVNAL